MPAGELNDQLGLWPALGLGSITRGMSYAKWKLGFGQSPGRRQRVYDLTRNGDIVEVGHEMNGGGFFAGTAALDKQVDRGQSVSLAQVAPRRMTLNYYGVA